MSIHIHATYKAGVIHPDHPLALPENTEVELTVIPVNGRRETAAGSDASDVRPSAPKLSAEEFRARLHRYAASVGTLPAEFSRADIYQDHD